MIRRLFFQLHWLLGISAGLVLAVMGLTGATMSFENEIMHALSADVMTVTPGPAPRLSPDALLTRIRAQAPGARIDALTVATDPRHSDRVRITPPGKHGHRYDSYVNPYTGALLGPAHGQHFFATVRRIHRWLALPGDGHGAGRTISGICALSLIYFALSGLYLRWPRKPLDWRAWWCLDLKRSGRNLYRHLHATIGAWLLVCYLISALTGLWWSYDWYRRGLSYVLTGHARSVVQRHPAAGTAPLARAWAGFLHAAGGMHGYRQVTIYLPSAAGPVRFRALLRDARHLHMTDQFLVDAHNGHVLSVDRYAERALGATLASSILSVHRGSFFGLPGRIVMTLSSLGLPLFTVTGLWLYIDRRRRKRRLDEAPAGETPADAGLLIAYASQTGGALRLARHTASAFAAAGQPARLQPLARLAAADLAAAGRALFVVSTYGDGEPPDEGRGFARRLMAAPAGLGHLDYAVLALGDREYPDFCGFGRRLEHWLQASGAQPLFERVELDGEDEAAQQLWRHRLATLGAGAEAQPWQSRPFAHWRLIERRHLNPGSVGGAVFHLALVPAGDAGPESWQAGDIAEVLPKQLPSRIQAVLDACGTTAGSEHHEQPLAAYLAGCELPACADAGTRIDALAPLRPREYSIASLADSGRIELLVRQVHDAHGQPGIASGWLTTGLARGDTIELRVRRNPLFHPPSADRPLILIGNGTGLAGLLAHLRHRAKHPRAPAWLLFGERSQAHDRFHDDALQQLLADGVLQRLDRVFSRDGEGYVQQRVAAQAGALRDWIRRGATILVCGSLHGMAPALDATLRDILGDDALEGLREQGRYRRDIY